MATYPQTYKNVSLCCIPSGMGGVLPAAIAKDHGEQLTVICLHEEYFPNWVLTINKSDIKPNSYQLVDSYKRIINGRLLANNSVNEAYDKDQAEYYQQKAID